MRNKKIILSMILITLVVISGCAVQKSPKQESLNPNINKMTKVDSIDSVTDNSYPAYDISTSIQRYIEIPLYFMTEEDCADIGGSVSSCSAHAGFDCCYYLDDDGEWESGPLWISEEDCVNSGYSVGTCSGYGSGGMYSYKCCIREIRGERFTQEIN